MKIAFGYKMSSGKDTSVDYLIKKYGGEKISFSKFLYNIMYYVQDLCGLEKEKDRHFLQLIGTEWGRKKDSDIWVNLTLKDIRNNNENKNFYCSDVRFLNEFKALKNDGWFCIKLIRNKVNKRRIGTGDQNHISENDLDSLDNSHWDFILDNNGDKENLFKKLDEIVKKLM